MKMLILLFSSMLQVSVTCQDVQKSENERKEIQRTISSCIGWVKDKNLEMLYIAIANDTNYINVSPGKSVDISFEDLNK